MSSRLDKKQASAAARAHRVRSKIKGKDQRPRLSVNISNIHISAQVIDDVNHKTLASVSSVGKKMTGSMTDKAAALGQELGKVCKTKKIAKVRFDRGSKKYHGRIAAFAEAARNAGLEF